MTTSAIGNDIVDLQDERAPHPRFAGRILSPREHQAFERAGAEASWLWRAWAAKEAAYKLMKRLDPQGRFPPNKLEVSADFTEVTVEELVLRTRWEVEAGFVH